MHSPRLVQVRQPQTHRPQSGQQCGSEWMTLSAMRNRLLVVVQRFL